MGIVPLCMPKAKLIQFVFGIFLILVFWINVKNRKKRLI